MAMSRIAIMAALRLTHAGRLETDVGTSLAAAPSSSAVDAGEIEADDEGDMSAGTQGWSCLAIRSSIRKQRVDDLPTVSTGPMGVVVNKTGNASAWALTAQHDIEAALDLAISDTTPAPPPPYNVNVVTTTLPDIQPLSKLTSSDQTMKTARQQAMRNCAVGDWEGWGCCEADASGYFRGRVQMRWRPVVNPPRADGENCPPLSQTVLCDKNKVCHVGNIPVTLGWPSWLPYWR